MPRTSLADTPNLSIGNNAIINDPTWANTGGNINITGVVSSANQAVTILASGNITSTSASQIETTGGNDVTLIAGYTLTPNAAAGNATTGTANIPGSAQLTAGSVTVNFNTPIGGNIDLSSSTQTPTISTTPSAAGSAGNVYLVADGTINLYGSFHSHRR